MTTREIEEEFKNKVTKLLSDYKEALLEEKGITDTFTVGRLIKELQKFDPYLPVLHNDTKYGPSYLSRVGKYVNNSGVEKGREGVLLSV